MVAVARQRDVGGSMAEHRLGHRAIFLNIFTSFLIFLCGVQLLAKLHLLQITSTYSFGALSLTKVSFYAPILWIPNFMYVHSRNQRDIGGTNFVYIVP
jgi:hypothetical protein